MSNVNGVFARVAVPDLDSAIPLYLTGLRYSPVRPSIRSPEQVSVPVMACVLLDHVSDHPAESERLSSPLAGNLEGRRSGG